MVMLTVRKIGNSLGVILPQEALALLRAEEGAQLALTASPDGARLTNSNPDFDRQMAIAKEGMRKYYNTLKELAK
ncbi:transcriptional regulator [soil metagenome]